MFAVAPYIVEIKDGKKQVQDLWGFFNKNSFRDELAIYYSNYLNKYQQSTNNNNRMFMIDHICQGTETSFSGRYRTGQFGFESQIYSMDAKKVMHTRKVDEADMIPFYFSFYMPKNTTSGQRARGLLLLGRFHALGVRHIVVPHLQQYFKSKFGDLTLNVERVVPKIVIDSLLRDGSLKAIRLIRKSLPKDISDVFSENDRDRVQEMEMIIRSKRKTHFSDINWIFSAFEKKSSPSEIFSIPSFPHDNIKLEIQIDGRKRTIDIGRPGNFSSNIELDGLQPDKDGHPKLVDWLEAADGLASNIVQSWGVPGVEWKSLP